MQDLAQSYCCHRLPMLLSVLILLFSMPLSAAEKADTLAEVTLSTVVTMALENHPQISAEKAEIEAALEDLGAARWSRFPTFGMEGRRDENNSDNSVARIEQPLWSGGRISGQVALANANVTLRQSRLQVAQQNLALEVMEHYLGVLRLERKLSVAQGNEREHTRLSDVMHNRVAAQVSPEADLILAKSRLNLAVTTRLQIRRELVVAQDRLNELVGEYLGPVRTIDADTFDSARALEVWQQMALNFSPDRKVVMAEIDQSRFERKLALAQSLPTVVLGYEQKLGDLDYAGQDRGLSYIGVNIELGAGLSSVSAVRAASRREQAARHRLSVQEIQIRSQVQEVWAEIQALRNQLPSVLSSAQSTSQIVESYLRQFQVGKKSWLDVLNVQREKAQAYYSLADTEFGLILAKLRLMVLAGEYRGKSGETK